MRGPLLPGEPAPPAPPFEGLAIRKGSLWFRLGTRSEVLALAAALPDGHPVRHRLEAVAAIVPR
jgi:hypothetical protein